MVSDLVGANFSAIQQPHNFQISVIKAIEQSTKIV